MTDASPSSSNDAGEACAWCEAPLRGKRYVQVVGASEWTLCSEQCLRAKRRDDALERVAVLRLRLKRLLVVASLVAACLTPHQGPPSPREPRPVPAADLAPLPGSFGPEWPPSEAGLLAELGRDAWLHPLPGPFRRMPSRDSRVFGAERPGDRPIECRKGHCGVDIGGEIWGEHVHAAHDGVVDRVQRATNEARGGHYVRLAHRDGTVFTQYFHLAAIPRRLEPGVRVKAGELIGLLGNTGVRESAAHLHFTVSVRPVPNGPEQYIDPEPLVALWPLRVPVGKSPVTVVSTTGRPGVPIGAVPPGVSRKRDGAKVKPKSVRKRGPRGAVKGAEPPAPPEREEEEEAAAEPSGE